MKARIIKKNAYPDCSFAKCLLQLNDTHQIKSLIFRIFQILLLFGGLGLISSCQSLIEKDDYVNKIAPGTLRPVATDTIGAREHPKVVATYGGIYKDAGAERAVASVVGRLVEASEDPSQSYRITILNSPAVNAFALPGGYLYVTRGLLALANDTSELAAVLAHEMAHVTSRHAIARLRRAEANELAEKVLNDIVEDASTAKKASLSSKLSFAKFSQEQEFQADKIGVKTLARAGFDPYAASRFLKSMGDFQSYLTAANMKPDAPDFLSSHPNTPKRVEQAVYSARQIGAPGIGERDKDSYLEKIDGLLYGSDPLQGFIRNQSFLHKALGISFSVPSGYSLENSPQAVLASNGKGTAMRFDGADISSFATLRQYMQSGWVNGLLQQSLRETKINGLKAILGSAITQGWSYRIAVIKMGRTGYRFIFATRSPSTKFDNEYKQTIESFQKLTPTQSARLQPLTIKIIRPTAGDTPAKLAQKMTGVTPKRRLALFMVLNGLVPGMPLKANTPVKLVQE